MKLGLKMYEPDKGRKTQKLDLINSRDDRYWIPAIQGRNGLDTSHYLYSYDRRAWCYYPYSVDKEWKYHFTVLYTSAGAFGIGIGILLNYFFG